jgi:hypothetical protein
MFGVLLLLGGISIGVIAVLVGDVLTSSDVDLPLVPALARRASSTFAGLDPVQQS